MIAFDCHSFRKERYAGKRVVIMGYGVYAKGSGIAATKYLAEAGAEVIVTDLRERDILSENMKQLEHLPNITWKLGAHDHQDFLEADFVVKNPGVHRDSPYLKGVSRIESDISLFLAEYRAMKLANESDLKLVAVTGSKGKSSTVSLVAYLLEKNQQEVFLAGNITTSPIFYLERLASIEKGYIILELSSWQLGDLAGKALLLADITMLTNLKADHLNYYQGNIRAYAEDKKVLFENLSAESYALVDLDDRATAYFVSQISRGTIGYYSQKALPDLYANGSYWKDDKTLICRQNDDEVEYTLLNIPLGILLENAAKAIWIVSLLMESETSWHYDLTDYSGLIYRCQLIDSDGHHRFFNDSAATIPEATIAAIKMLASEERALILILGGASKGSDLSVLTSVMSSVTFAYLLDGTANEEYLSLLESTQTPYLKGCQQFESIIVDFEDRFSEKYADLLLSPGVASFGLFINEFDRGERFSTAVKQRKKRG